MIATKYIVTGALVAIVVALELRKSKRPVCGAGASWKVATELERELFKTGPTADSIRKWGGYCARTGVVSDPYPGGDVDDAGAEEEPAYLITSPSQVM